MVSYFQNKKAGPEILPFSFPTEVEEGQLLQVSCVVTKGDEPITLQWYKDSTPLVSSNKFMVNNVDSTLSMLILRGVAAKHSGTYSCVAYNTVGRATVTAKLNVKGNN